MADEMQEQERMARRLGPFARNYFETPRLGEHAYGAARLGGRGVGAWGSGIGRWFGFVGRRRKDDGLRIFPGPGRAAIGLACFAGVVALLVLFADPPYLAMVRAEGFSPPPLFERLTLLGRSEWVLYPTGLALVLFSLLRPGGMVARSRHLLNTLILAAYYMFTTVAFSGLLAMALKNIVGRARPLHVAGDAIWQSRPFGDTYDFASFPSGHATTAGAIAIGLALLFPRLRWVFVVLGAWVAVSRPAIGVHFPSDVFAGFCFGAAFSYFYARSFARKRLLFGLDAAGRLRPRYGAGRPGKIAAR